MASLPLTLELQGSSNFTFAVPPGFEPRCEPVWKDAANPPEITELRWVWEFTGAQMISTDGTQATLWSQWLAFVARLQTRGSSPTYARLVRDPSGSNTTVWTLGPSTYEQFKIEAIQAGRSNVSATIPAKWRVAIPVDLTISAVQKLPDSNGIVGWDQEVRYTYDEAGLQIVEWRTTISTAEGTSALTKAQTYGLIPIATYGDTYSYLTNGDAGVEVTVLDDDQQNSRTPTKALAVCRLRQWGVAIGTTGPGVSPSTVSYSIRTKRDKQEEVVTYTASAVGPAASVWVLSKVPSGLDITESETIHEQALKRYEATWTTRRKINPDSSDGTKRTLVVEITGGHAGFSFEGVADGYAPVRFEDPLSPWQVTVRIKISRSTGTGKNDELPFPEPLTSIGLSLDYDASTEGEPVLADDGINWTREAVIVYRSAAKPRVTQIRSAMETSQGTVQSYYL